MDFIHLHNHTHYSLTIGKDGYNTPAELVARAVELGHQGIAITDHGSMFGVVELGKAAKKAGIKPIFGMEGYVVAKDHTIQDKTNAKYSHLLMLAMNQQGYQNLMAITSIGHIEGTYGGRPRVSYPVIERHHTGIIFTSACVGGDINQAIKAGDKKKARELAAFYRDLVGDRFYLELQYHHNVPELRDYNAELVRIGSEMGIQCVVTSDAHFTLPEYAEPHRFLKASRWNKSYTDFCDQYEPMLDDTYALNGADVLWPHFKQYGTRPFENTVEIANRIEDIPIGFGKVTLPKVHIPAGETAETYLKLIAERGLRERGIESDAYYKRLYYELDVINQTGFPDYMLIVWDMVQYARKRGIPCLPRGSAGASLVLYCLGITDVDPIPNGLLFERFLSPERLEMPDIDIDFADARRAEVIQYVADTYGRDNVAQIMTFGTLMPKAALKDAGRTLEIPLNEVEALARMVHMKAGSIQQALKMNEEMKRTVEANASLQELVTHAEWIEHTVKSVGMHACGVVVSAEPLRDLVPLHPTKDGGLMAAFEGPTLADLGLLKMDMLGLKNLSVVADTIKAIKENHGIDIDLKTIPLDDKKVFEALARGETANVFQLESAGMTKYLRELKPTRVQDLYAMVALYRPGPLEQVPVYIKNKNNPRGIEYLHPILKPILEDTYGVIVYQEQIMLLLQAIAGYTLGNAYIVLKAIGKKKRELMATEEPRFKKGCVDNGLTKKQADTLWDLIQPFAGYSFNRPHATLYGLLSYQTAWLKNNYPAEYMAATLTHDSGNIDDVAKACNESRKIGIDILSPSVNESNEGFTIVSRDGKSGIRFGLSAIKNAGDAAVASIIAERNTNGPFEGFEDFLSRSTKEVGKKALEAFVKAGACDEWGLRQTLLEQLPDLMKERKAAATRKTSAVASMFGEEDLAKLKPKKKIRQVTISAMEVSDSNEWRIERLNWERDLLGFYLTAHPITEFLKETKPNPNWLKIADAVSIVPNSPVAGIALVQSMKKLQTKKGDSMAVLTLSDETGDLGAVAFPKVYAGMETALMLVDTIVGWKGKIDSSRGETQIILDAIGDIDIAKNAPPIQKRRIPIVPVIEEEEFDSDADLHILDDDEPDIQPKQVVLKKDNTKLYTIIVIRKEEEGSAVIKMTRIANLLMECDPADIPVYIAIDSGGKLLYLEAGPGFNRNINSDTQKKIESIGVNVRRVEKLPFSI